MSSKKKSVSSTINELISAVPKVFGSDDEVEETQAKVVDYEDDQSDNEDNLHFQNSNIRIKNNNLLEEIDTRYKAKKVSVKEIFNQYESSDDEDFEMDGVREKDYDKDLTEHSSDEMESKDDNDYEEEREESDQEYLTEENKFKNGDDDDDDDDYDDDVDDDDDSVDDESNPLRRNRRFDNNFRALTETNIRTEIEKGNCVREQLKLWENLLEMRIKLQKCLVSSNKMPQYDVYQIFQTDKELKAESKNTTMKLSVLLSNLLKLQSNLLENFPETTHILSKKFSKQKAENKIYSSQKNHMEEEIPSDTEDEQNENEENTSEDELENDGKEKGPPKKKLKSSEFEEVIAKNHKAYSNYRNMIIQKWNDKTRIASGVISKGINQSAVKQIEFSLSNKEKLIKKTQLKRSEYDIIGKVGKSIEETDGRRIQEYDEEIYDDDDFYHQLLRELIEYKSADVTDPIQLSKQWVQLQNMRSKMKRKIDTRATKGRKIRYNVHQKLVNYMAPITVDDTWTDHAKNELFNSLFGKIKPAERDNESNDKKSAVAT